MCDSIYELERERDKLEEALKEIRETIDNTTEGAFILVVIESIVDSALKTAD